MRTTTTILLSAVFFFLLTSSSSAYYHYHTGRWLNQDPIGYQDSINLYAYVGSNPVNKFDSYGLFVCFDDCPPEPELDPQTEGSKDCKGYDDDWDINRDTCIQECYERFKYRRYDEPLINCINTCKRTHVPPWELTDPDHDVERFYWANWDADQNCIRQIIFFGHGGFRGDADDPDAVPFTMTTDLSDTQNLLDRLHMPPCKYLCCHTVIVLKGCRIGLNTNYMENLVPRVVDDEDCKGKKFTVMGCKGDYRREIVWEGPFGLPVFAVEHEWCEGGWASIHVQR